MKIKQSSSRVSPFGGLNFVFNELSNKNIGDLLNQELPVLPNQCQYDWKDLLYSFWSIFFCGGDSIEDLSDHLSFARIGKQAFHNIPSPDRVLERFKQLSIPSDLCKSPRGKSTHEINSHEHLNNLNLKLLKQLNLLDQKELTLDYDNTIIYTRKSDARFTYKNKHGYCPGVGMIGENIVFVENRNGNSDAKTLQLETLQRMFSILEAQNIEIDNFRADGASYQMHILYLLNEKVKRFYIRASMSDALARAISEIKHWEKVELKDETAYRGEVKFTPFLNVKRRAKLSGKPLEFRLVVTKILRADKQINAFTSEAYNYRAVITNDWDKSQNEVVDFYNQRGSEEKEFDVLKNDFGWQNLPFSKLNQNTVYLIFSAMARNIYSYMIRFFSQKINGLKTNFRIKKFIFRFITIPAKWIKTARQTQLVLYGNIDFKT